MTMPKRTHFRQDGPQGRADLPERGVEVDVITGKTRKS
jgi:hypothetical protein